MCHSDYLCHLSCLPGVMRLSNKAEPQYEEVRLWLLTPTYGRLVEGVHQDVSLYLVIKQQQCFIGHDNHNP